MLLWQAQAENQITLDQLPFPLHNHSHSAMAAINRFSSSPWSKHNTYSYH